MQISKATGADTEVISEILGEIAEYYGDEPVPGDQDQVRRALFDEQPAATCLLARDGDEVLGLASYSLLWPAAHAGTSLYLMELYVRESARRRGVASAFMAALKSEALAAGCSQIQWTADADNPSALDFYESLGAEQKARKVFYRLGL
ncbi:GNAT family N-acetyltransferase [Streptomyces sp. NBC_01465]|uniref:GNAT family N-acetyltransferase n=1 Tax=Streptomyces sp. NBC_01465 TaxID=2903878 RepID=UPI002E35A817|nr:GNAT family N-acetyltransferase [Streptomyces sp. NBC_01465]